MEKERSSYEAYEDKQRKNIDRMPVVSVGTLINLFGNGGRRGMKAVLISIQPKWCELIARGKKTVEVRKTKPKIEVPFKCYIYCTKGDPIFTQSAFCDNISNGKVIGEFVCDRIYNIPFLIPFDIDDIWHPMFYGFESMTCLSDWEIDEYLGQKDGYGWHISDLVIYDKPKDLSEFYTYNGNGDYCGGCVHHECPIDTEPCRSCQGDRKYFYRPPQSWCYVEEVGDERNRIEAMSVLWR